MERDGAEARSAVESRVHPERAARLAAGHRQVEAPGSQHAAAHQDDVAVTPRTGRHRGADGMIQPQAAGELASLVDGGATADVVPDLLQEVDVGVEFGEDGGGAAEIEAAIEADAAVDVVTGHSEPHGARRMSIFS